MPAVGRQAVDDLGAHVAVRGQTDFFRSLAVEANTLYELYETKFHFRTVNVVLYSVNIV